MKFARACIASVLGATALVEFLFWGAGGIGLSILFLILLAAYFIACGFPKAGIRHAAEHVFLTVLITALFMSYTFFACEPLKVINFIALIFLMGLLFLHGTVGKNIAWDRPVFHAELWTGYFLRPFVCLARPWKESSELRGKRKNASLQPGKASEKKKLTFQILAAALAAVPLLCILVSLLAASDAVFRNLFKPVLDALLSLHIDEVAAKFVLFLFLLPFTASAIWSYRDHLSIVASAGKYLGSGTDTAAGAADTASADTSAENVPKTAPSASVKKGTGKSGPASFAIIPAASAVTILAMINLVYLLYAGVQFAYIFGVFAGSLPDGLTPAQYARNGFFELAFISCINVALLLISIRLTRREGRGGLWIRFLAVFLLALSFVQLVSALLRMRLYVLVFGFTQLRFFVAAFMLLLAVYFLFILLREFVSGFPLLRSMVFAGAVSLVILNYSVPDAQIVKYNIAHYQSGELSHLDTEYIMNSLSADGKILLLQKVQQLPVTGTGMQTTISEILGGQGMHSEMLRNDMTYRSQNWKSYNMSQEKLSSYISKNS